jgi:nucleotide-binding universal stress UspA family protein
MSMTIAEILVPLCGAPADAGALDTALAVAAPFGAHVTALFAVEDAREAVSAADLRESVPARRARIADARERARLALAAAAGRADAVVRIAAEKYGTLSACYREVPGPRVDALAGAARFCDLVVFPHGAAESEMRDAFGHVLIQSDKPVLLAGRDAPTAALDAVAIGWDGSLSAARALAAALPLLERAKTVQFLTVGDCTGIAVAEAVGYLALHGVTASLRALGAAPVPVGQTLLAGAKDADLLVLGAYGHSRTLERIFGGVTVHVLAHAAKAILLAH